MALSLVVCYIYIYTLKSWTFYFTMDFSVQNKFLPKFNNFVTTRGFGEAELSHIFLFEEVRKVYHPKIA